MYRSFAQEDGKGGNTAAVVRHNSMDREQMMNVAQSLDVSETAFIESIANKTKYGAYRILFYTRNRSRVPLCGHATLAAGKEIFSAEGFANEGRCVLFYENENTIEAQTEVQMEHNGRIFYRHDIPPHKKYLDVSNITDALETTISSADFNFLPVERGGVGFVALTQESFDALPEHPNAKVLQRVLENMSLIGTHVFTLCNSESDFVARTRNFSPVVGIDEENATGSDTAMLTKELLEQDLLSPERYIRQKYIQGRTIDESGTLYTEIRDDGIWVGGLVADAGVIKIDLR